MLIHILLIERDGDVREALTGILRMHRWRVTAVADPVAALARLRMGLAPDLLLMDAPQADSVTGLLAEAAAAGQSLAHLPVIAMVAAEHTPAGTLLQVLRKPFAVEPLVTLIRSLKP